MDGDATMAKNIKYQMQRALELKYRPGTSKRAEKRKNREAAYNNAKESGADEDTARKEANQANTSDYIHSVSTLRTYIQQARQYGDWLVAHGHNRCTMEDAKNMAYEYILSQESNWSKHTARSALAKVFGCAGNDLCELEKRDPDKIERGHTETERAAAIERNHPELAEVCRSLGMRHFRELVGITAENFHAGDPSRGQNPDDLYCKIRGKGGRKRDAFVPPGMGREYIKAAIQAHPEGPLFHVPSHANVHRWRADYAQRCYRYAMENGMANGKLYRCRDNSGRKFDKGALAWVSEQLGHGPDRCYTVAHNYLSYGDADK